MELQKARARRLITLYNLTIEEWEKIAAHQNNVCYICLKKQKSGKRLATDHSHKTGLVRGLLCSQCNRLFGKIERMGWITIHLERLLEFIRNPPAVTAIGREVFSFPGRFGTKRHREFLRIQKKLHVK